MTTRSRFTALLLTGTLAGALACSTLFLPAPALAVSDDAVLKRMDNVLEENARLREETWKLHKSRDREAARQAAEALAASEERLERTRAEALAHVSGVSPAQVEALRKDGKSWGQTSGELGVHPGFLGIDKTPLYESRTTRKAKSSKVATKKGPRGKARAVAKEPARTVKKSTVAAAKAKGTAKPKAQQKSKAKAKKLTK
ncbi:MAG: hypothetical protein A2051_09070 [Desulfovibrionales bacterium GWA2_65_9]|nr:MAG: hypothetical protein A2051_09070 [Desulfovibrionales bacterium GWA2_65_9]